MNIGIVAQTTVEQCTHRRISIPTDTAVELDTCFGECCLRTAADASANQSVHAVLHQEANQKRLHDLAVMQSRADAQESEVRTFIKEIRRYAAIEELDESVLNRLISKILIGEVKKVDGQKVQEVRIVYNFVGEIPEIAA